MRCIPYVEVVSILCVTLVLGRLVINVDCWCCSVGYCAFGIVMLPRPVVPFSPITVNDNFVIEADWFNVSEMFDIWELVTFPLIIRSTVVPLSVITGTVVADGVGEGVGAISGVKVEAGVMSMLWKTMILVDLMVNYTLVEARLPQVYRGGNKWIVVVILSVDSKGVSPTPSLSASAPL